MSDTTSIDLDQLKTQAKELHKACLAGDAGAITRLSNANRRQPDSIRLADAQHVIAEENGYPGWSALKHHAQFLEARAALDAGDANRLATCLMAAPQLVSYRCNRGDWYEQGYFKGAMLLHHVAGNPIRCPIPAGILDVARVLLLAGAKAGAKTEGGADTVELLLTSRQASEAGVALPLLELLYRAGNAQMPAGDPLDYPLLNEACATAEALIAKGAKASLRHFAGLGWQAQVQEALNSDDTQAELDSALLLASVCGKPEVAEILLDNGARADQLLSLCGESPRTAMHEAANRGYLQIVTAMLKRGADRTICEPAYGGTPAGWAEYGGHPEIVALLKGDNSS